MSWIKEFAKGSYSLYSGNTISAFQPLDFYHYYGLWYDLWLAEVIKAMEKVDAENKSYQELKSVAPTPSNMRALIQKLIPAYIGSGRANKGLYKRYANFVARMLQEACPTDPFGKSSTPLHSEAELKKIIESISWNPAGEMEARTLGKLITSAGSIVHGIYNDVVTDFAWDAYGPYENQKLTESEYTLLIRNFSNLQPDAIWDKNLLPSVNNFQIYQLYQNVEWEIACVGCHTIVKNGDPIKGLKYYSVVADGKPLPINEINNLIFELAKKAEEIYLKIRQKDFEELKIMVMIQECYQLKALFDLAGMDWKPTAQMLEAIKNKPLQTGIFPEGVMMTSMDEYFTSFRLGEFEKEVLT